MNPNDALWLSNARIRERHAEAAEHHLAMEARRAAKAGKPRGTTISHQFLSVALARLVDAGRRARRAVASRQRQVS